MDKFIISKHKEINFSHEIKLNKNFSLFSNIKPDVLFKGKLKYLFFGRINGFFNNGKFFKLSNFRLKSKINLLINKKYILDGNYFFLKINKNKIEIKVDDKGLYDVFYSNIKNDIYFSNSLSLIRDKISHKLSFDNFSILTALSSLSKRPPSKRTFFNEIKRLDSSCTNILDGKNFRVKENNFMPMEIKQPINDKSFLKTYQNELSSFSNIGNNRYKVLFMSSGWDSLMILKLLIDRFGKKRVKPLIARLKFSKSTKNFNQYELDKAKKICEHFKIKLNYIDVDYKKIKSYIKETEKIANEKMLTGTFAFFLHYRLIKLGNKKFGPADFFSGEISDGSHNFGFSQYLTLVDNDSNGYREYCDKMMNYLFGPTFFQSVLKKNFLKDPIFNFLSSKLKIKLKKIKHNKMDVFKNFMQSMFVVSNRFPLNSEISPFLNKNKQKEYLNTFNKDYLKSIKFKNNNQIYSCYLYLYNKFHWQGSTVRPAYHIANNFSSNFINIFWNANTQKTLSMMPESFGRGLELRSTKFPEKEILKKNIDVDKLNIGPHSYLSDTSDADPYYEVIFNSTYRKLISDTFKKFDATKEFDRKYFDIKFLKKIINCFNYKKNDIPAETIYSLYCVCKYLSDIKNKNGQ
jgi:hypothetical protein